MSNYTVIDQKVEEHSYGLWPIKEKITTTIALVNLGSKKVGLTYDAEFSGIKDGHVNGGPAEIDGNMTQIINENPKVELVIAQYQNTGSYASMNVQITVDMPVLGTHAIFNQTLGGSYSAAGTGWQVALKSAAAAVEARREKR